MRCQKDQSLLMLHVVTADTIA